MKQHINLYPASCQPQKIRFNFLQLMLVTIGCFAFIALVEVLISKQQESAALQQKQAELQNVALQNELADVVVRLQANRPPKSKYTQKQQLIDEVAAKQRLLRNLRQIDLGFVVNFSDLMLGFSKADIKQVSIKQFTIKDGQLGIRGAALHSDSVPKWLTKIQQTNELKAVAFTGVEIVQDKQRFQFKLSNIHLDRKGDN